MKIFRIKLGQQTRFYVTAIDASGQNCFIHFRSNELIYTPMKEHSIIVPPSECLLSGEQLTVQLTAMSTFSDVEEVTLEQLKSEELIGSQVETRLSKIGDAELTVIADRFTAERFTYDPVTGVDMGMNRPHLFKMKNP